MIKHAGESVSSASRTRVYTLLKDLIHNDDDQIRNSAASILGIVSQVRIILPRKYFFPVYPILFPAFSRFLLITEMLGKSYLVIYLMGIYAQNRAGCRS